MVVYGLHSLKPQLRPFGAKIIQAVEDLVAAKIEGTYPPHLDKSCGYDSSGVLVSGLQVDLRMRHYRLAPGGMDPLLIYQQFDDFLCLNAVTQHRHIFQGREEQWCWDWQKAICWD